MQKALIISDPKVMMGKPVVAGTRITVELILEELAGGRTIEELLKAYPHLNQESIYAALQFAAETVRAGWTPAGVGFEVAGFPPAKSEALSMFNQSHSHALRVKDLLAKAQEATTGIGFKLFTGPIGLELTVFASPDIDSWDATNYLGGVADALQEKSHLTIPLGHFGDLINVALYQNDRQIREVRYRQEAGDSPTYRLRIWPLPDVA